MKPLLLLAACIAALPALGATIPAGIYVESRAARAGLDVPGQVLAEELGQRLGTEVELGGKGRGITFHLDAKLPAEAFHITQDTRGNLSIAASGKLGALFGVGHLLRNASIHDGQVDYLGGDHTEVPAFPLRGHQLGYRATANSYDAWTPEQFDTYIRELAFFGTNMIEGIPFHDERPIVNKTTSRREMNRRMSEICARYGLQYWVWTPADFDLKDGAKRSAQLAQYDELFTDCKQLDAIFFPGGDPGDNPPSLVLPYLEEVAKHLTKRHPQAKAWLSLQGFTPAQCEEVYAWVRDTRPKWLGGIVAGPSAPPIQESRRALPAEYPVRDYPDITHMVRCQNPVPWWDPAYALTLGRECISVRPLFFANYFRFFEPFVNGFGTYSDGVHDDVNKILLSRLGSDPNADVRQILVEYARLFFGAEHAEKIADALLALEKNWDGPLAENGSVEGTYTAWHDLMNAEPELIHSWRGQMFLTLAAYDVYTRRRLIAESGAEATFNAACLAHTGDFDDASLDHLVTLLTPAPFSNQDMLRDSIVGLYEALWQSIGLQTSVEKYQASGRERGCSLELLDYPLNNRWWIEDEFKKVRALPVAERAAAVRRIATWEQPGPGSYYDALGHPGKAPHVVRGLELGVEPDLERAILPTQWWTDNGMSRLRLTWQTWMDWPAALRYDGLDPKASYTLRINGYGTALPVANGTPLSPSLSGKEVGEVKEFPIPQSVTASGRIEVTFQRPAGEEQLNWRQQSRASEVWLLKH